MVLRCNVLQIKGRFMGSAPWLSQWLCVASAGAGPTRSELLGPQVDGVAAAHQYWLPCTGIAVGFLAGVCFCRCLAFKDFTGSVIIVRLRR